MRFGRFLNVTPIGVNTEWSPKDLTEGKFRKYWERTEGTNERQRFAAIQRLMQEDAGGKQKMAVVAESGLYKAIMRSDEPVAGRFQDWVCGEVLPSIRKTGAYVHPGAPQPQAIDMPALATAVATAVTTVLKPYLDRVEQRQRDQPRPVEPSKLFGLDGQNIPAEMDGLRVWPPDRCHGRVGVRRWSTFFAANGAEDGRQSILPYLD
jgi:BRO family, N-terminal domain